MHETKSILVLGSGPVSAPTVEYLTRDPLNRITVTSRTLRHAQALKKAVLRASTRGPRHGDQPEGTPHKRHEVKDLRVERQITSIALDATSPALEGQIRSHDLVVSLVPPTLHPIIAKLAIKHKKHFVCTSFARPELVSLDESAAESVVTLLTEVGVAPGLDHVFAVCAIREIHRSGCLVDAFRSYVGGLAVSDCRSWSGHGIGCDDDDTSHLRQVGHNPLAHKFSWNPYNTILSQLYAAEYLDKGNTVKISGVDLMDSAWTVDVGDDRHALVGFPSGSSLPFQQFYDIPEARTVVRGTLRYRHNTLMISTLQKMGWLSTERTPSLETVSTSSSDSPSSSDPPKTWSDVTAELLGVPPDLVLPTIQSFPHLRDERDQRAVIASLAQIGLVPCPCRSSDTDTPIVTQTETPVRQGSQPKSDTVNQSDASATRSLDPTRSADQYPPALGEPLATLCARLTGLCAWEAGDRDTVVLQHSIDVVRRSDGKRETRTWTFERVGRPVSVSVDEIPDPTRGPSALALEGCPEEPVETLDSTFPEGTGEGVPDGVLVGFAEGDSSAMGRSTGLMCGIAVQLLLDGHEYISKPGLVRPYEYALCAVLRQKLEDEGLAMVERVVEW